MMKFFLFCLMISFKLFFNVLCINDIGCRDEDNKLIDWFYLYKLPTDRSSNGLNYFFITSNVNNVWTYSNKTIDDDTSLPGHTISQLYNNNEILSVMYNDEPPSGPVSFDEGHTKGVIAAQEDGGFWLVHSVPHYPPSLNEERYGYPKTGLRYGQSFLCISMNSTMIDVVGRQMIYNEPYVYYTTNNTDRFSSIFPNLIKSIKKVRINIPPYSNIETIHTNDNVPFKIFAKNRHFHEDLYKDLVAPALETNLYLETWLNGAGRMSSNCTGKQYVYNINNVKINEEIQFPNSHDHSKWAVSRLPSHNWICVGDINHEIHQMERGGGTVCLQNEEISIQYQNIINNWERCENEIEVNLIL